MHSGTAGNANFSADDDRNSTVMLVWLLSRSDAVPSRYFTRQQRASPAPTLRLLADRTCGKRDDVMSVRLRPGLPAVLRSRIHVYRGLKT